MSILINSMEMPESCDECLLNNGITCYAVPEYKEDGVVGRTNDRPNWCPLVPFPPHGRLIDADLLCKVLRRNSENEWNSKTAPFSWAYAYDCVKDTVENMPTVIPAEGVKHDER